MGADISAQDRSYRRGLVLGFTLAEIMVLIIFALLLALSWQLVAKDKEIDRLSQSLKEKEADVITLTELTIKLKARIEQFERFDDFDDLFRELEQAKKKRAAQEQANAALREKVEVLERENDALEERAAMAERIMEIAREAHVPTEDPEKTVREIASRLEQLKKVKEGMKAVGLDDSQVKEFVENTLGKLAEAERRADRLEGQLRNLQRKMVGLGKGTEMPACWASRKTGKPEYIFNTALTSNGIIVQDNALPHRAAEQAQLPLQAMVFKKEMRPGQFRVMSKPILEWSVKEGCRFFVRVYDQTRDDEKMIYKRHLRTVLDYFYHYEVPDGRFNISDE